MAERGFWKSLKSSPGLGAGFPPVAREPIQPHGTEDDPSRRRFLALAGASAALAAGVACSNNRGGIVPYTKKPEEVVPGVADYYASTFQEGASAFPVLVKAREGRPIHVAGNDEDPWCRGKTSFRATADILGLYDPDRLRGPLLEGRSVSWEKALSRIGEGLRKAKDENRAVLLVAPAAISPTRRTVLELFRKSLPTLEVIQWEPAVDHQRRTAEEALFGKAAVVRHRFGLAKAILSLQADFLGADAEAPAVIQAFASGRQPERPGAPMSRLYVFEGAMTVTGSKADHRSPVRPSALSAFAFALAKELHARHGIALPAGTEASLLDPFDLAAWGAANGVDHGSFSCLAGDFARAGRESLVTAGPSLPPEAHAAVSLLNAMLGAEGYTVEADAALATQELASPQQMEKVKSDLAAGRYAAAIIWEANPLHASPDPEGWAEALSKVPMTVRLGLLADEMARACGLVLPVNHWLESWNDFQIFSDVISLQQPPVAPLYDTLQAEEVFLRTAATLGSTAGTDYHSFLRERWKREVYPAGSLVPFAEFWNSCLHDGLLQRDADAAPARVLNGAALAPFAKAAAKSQATGMELFLFADAKTYDGRYGNNGWLQELPDPVTKNTWGNPLSLSISDTRRLGLKDGDVVKAEVAGRSVVVPILVQPGQAAGVAVLALGYGRAAGSVAAKVGVNGWPLAGTEGLLRQGLSLAATGESARLARTQEHHHLHGRDIARLWTLAEYASKAAKPRQQEPVTLYPEQKFPGHKWGMAIDLSACVGCGGCVIACQSENNIPVVGPERVRKGREMHWIRIDRYYEGPEEAPRTVHQPMLCQQCDNAPCENVCPVNATNHSPDGLNQMAYQRCVGTRYCANNCPYKVRRFNFFDFTSDLTEPLDLAFNPEVTVRPRGVMEKCTFCVQRIRNAEQVAKDEGRRLRDGEIVPACAAACPAEAIVFGDLKEPNSRVSILSASNRCFKVLEELGIRPAVTYLADLRNPSGGEV